MPRNTKKALADSLKALLRTRPLSKVTIADITEGCGINRMTFYYHFRDIYDLVEWICREECSAALGGPLDRETWQDGFCDLCRYVLENRSFFVNVCNSIGREQAENYLYRVTYSILRSAVDELAGDMLIGEEEKKFIADFYKFAFVGVELDWLRSGMREPPEELAGRLSRLLNGQFDLALKNLSRE